MKTWQVTQSVAVIAKNLDGKIEIYRAEIARITQCYVFVQYIGEQPSGYIKTSQFEKDGRGWGWPLWTLVPEEEATEERVKREELLIRLRYIRWTDQSTEVLQQVVDLVGS